MSPRKNLFTLTAVSKATGLSPLLIRAWENRYGAIQPKRNDANRRLYNQEDIDKLILLYKATQSGFRIGDIAGLSISELKKIIPAGHTDLLKIDFRPTATVKKSDVFKSSEEWVSCCMRRIEELNAVKLEVCLTEASVHYSIPGLINNIIIPLITDIGKRWQSGSIRIHQEHLATSVIRQYLLKAHSSIIPHPDAPLIVITTPSGQRHDIGALVFLLASASMGWRSVYLGPDLPAEEIAAAVFKINANAIALSIVYPEINDMLKNEIVKLRSIIPPSVRIILGGNAVDNTNIDFEAYGVETLNNPFDLKTLIYKY